MRSYASVFHSAGGIRTTGAADESDSLATPPTFAPAYPTMPPTVPPPLPGPMPVPVPMPRPPPDTGLGAAAGRSAATEADSSADAALRTIVVVNARSELISTPRVSVLKPDSAAVIVARPTGTPAKRNPPRASVTVDRLTASLGSIVTVTPVSAAREASRIVPLTVRVAGADA